MEASEVGRGLLVQHGRVRLALTAAGAQPVVELVDRGVGFRSADLEVPGRSSRMTSPRVRAWALTLRPS